MLDFYLFTFLLVFLQPFLPSSLSLSNLSKPILIQLFPLSVSSTPFPPLYSHPPIPITLSPFALLFHPMPPHQSPHPPPFHPTPLYPCTSPSVSYLHKDYIGWLPIFEVGGVEVEVGVAVKGERRVLGSAGPVVC